MKVVRSVSSAMGTLRTDIRVRAEGMGVISKAVVTFLLVLYDSNIGEKQGRLTLLAFAGGQLSYGIVLNGVYLTYYRNDLLRCAPYNMRKIMCVLSTSAPIVDPSPPQCWGLL
jgi:hypothetical protein